MKALIEGTDEEHAKVFVTDNNHIEHDITLELSTGDIVYHESDGYPESDADCTQEQIEHINQACRYARYHVYRERGHDVIPSTENPDRLLAAMIALLQLSESECADLFGDLRTQLRSHYDGSTVELPFEDVDPEEVIVYQKEIYVEPDPVDSKQTVSNAFTEILDSSDESDAEDRLTDAVMTLLQDESVREQLQFEIEAVSELHYLHDDGYGNQQVHRGGTPLDRDPDARLELLAQDPDEFDSFQLYLVAHLGYQVRDCYLSMGIEPPETFQEKGTGTFERTLDQRFIALYDDYWNDDAVIDSWQPTSG